MTQVNLQEFLRDTSGLGRTTTLSRERGLRAILLHLKADEEIPEHQTRGAITVQCLKGEVIFSSGDEHVELGQASLIGLAPGRPHSVAAQQDTLLLVTISEPIGA